MLSNITREEDFVTTAIANGRVKDAGRPAAISHVIVVGLLRFTDLAIVAATGELIRPAFYATAGTDRYYTGAAIAVMLGTAIVFHLQGLYHFSALNFRCLKRQLGKLTSAWTVVFLLAATTMFALKISGTYSRLWVAVWFSLALIEMASLRIVLVLRARHWVAQGRLARHVAIVGFHCRSTEKLIERLVTDDSIRIVGFFDDRIKREGWEVPRVAIISKAVVTWLGDTTKLIEYARAHRVDHIVLSLPWSATQRIKGLTERFSILPVDVSLAPEEIGLTLEASMTSLSDVPLLGLARRPLGDWQRFAKTVFDYLAATAMLVVLSPLLVTIALAIKLDSRGPVFFKQRRPGFNNEMIGVLKFRTMYANMTDQKGERLTERRDPRVTRVGRTLRRLSFDELPQLLNVIRGEMSLVGPRPHPVSAKAAGRYYQEVVSDYASRHRVKPGITGWAQVCGWRGETATEEQIRKRVEHDLFYINNWSFGFDVRILFLTALASIRHAKGKAF